MALIYRDYFLIRSEIGSSIQGWPRAAAIEGMP